MTVLAVDVMAYSLFVGALSFSLAMLWAHSLVQYLRARKVGKAIRTEGPQTHFLKAGTPTMGGILIFVTVLLVTVPLNLYGRLSMLLPLGVIVACGIVGAVDDWSTLTGKSGEGMRARVKMLWLLVVAVIAALVLHFYLGYANIHIPFVGARSIGLLYVPIAIIIIVGTAHAVNLTDGLDTLAGGTLALAFVAYGIVAYLQGQDYLVTFCFTVVGATVAFLWFNAHPAQIFVGDTGSLALGATLGTVALMTGHWLLLPIIGIIFVLEAISVMLQVGYFKLTKGKRIFNMTPLHHHFELVGWSETQVAMRFWLMAIVGAMIGIALALKVPG